MFATATSAPVSALLGAGDADSDPAGHNPNRDASRAGRSHWRAAPQPQLHDPAPAPQRVTSTQCSCHGVTTTRQRVSPSWTGARPRVAQQAQEVPGSATSRQPNGACKHALGPRSRASHPNFAAAAHTAHWHARTFASVSTVTNWSAVSVFHCSTAGHARPWHLRCG